MRRLIFLGCLSAMSGATSFAQTAASPVLSALEAELDRSMGQLKTQPVPPYYLSYEVTEADRVEVSGAYGTLTRSDAQRRRNLEIDLRVGDYKFDNTHPIRGGDSAGRSRYSWVETPVDDNPDAIRAIV